jgi:hypothetical protein
MREEAERLDRLHEEGSLDALPYVRLRPYARESSQVYAIRIPVSRLRQIRLLADARGEPPTSLLREWVLERLDSELAIAVGEEGGRYELPIPMEPVRRKGSPRPRKAARGGKTASPVSKTKTHRAR